MAPSAQICTLPVASEPGDDAPDRVETPADYWRNQKKSGRALWRFALQNPRQTWRAAVNTFRLPVLDAMISDAPDGKTIRTALNRHPRLVRSLTLARSGVCLVHVPAEARDYSAGSSKQTLRRKVRAAQNGGVTWRSVDESSERRALLNRIHQVLPTKSNYAYTNDNSALLDSGLWTVAFGSDGEPLVIAVTPFDGEWALLQFCNALGETKLHSDARYFLTQIVVERLSGLGVRHLFDGVCPHRLSAGLWHFQRMIGFQMARVRVLDPVAVSSAPGRRPLLNWSDAAQDLRTRAAGTRA